MSIIFKILEEELCCTNFISFNFPNIAINALCLYTYLCFPFFLLEIDEIERLSLFPRDSITFDSNREIRDKKKRMHRTIKNIKLTTVELINKEKVRLFFPNVFACAHPNFYNLIQISFQ